MKKARISAISAEQDAWVRQAYVAASAAAKDLVGDRGPIRANAVIGSLAIRSGDGSPARSSGRGFRPASSKRREKAGASRKPCAGPELAPCPWTQGAVVGPAEARRRLSGF